MKTPKSLSTATIWVIVLCGTLSCSEIDRSPKKSDRSEEAAQLQAEISTLKKQFEIELNHRNKLDNQITSLREETKSLHELLSRFVAQADKSQEKQDFRTVPAQQ